MTDPRPPSPSSPARFSRRVFAVALGFLLVVAVLGTLLRLHAVVPLTGFAYSNILHAHSHVAFLGWVFNAFFALALTHFIPPVDRRGYLRLFVVLQVAVVGMLVAYPVQGYGAVSIAFSSLHMVGSGVFAWKLWRSNTASPAASGHLGAALLFLVVSGLGPLALGPLAAAGLRDTPAYQLSIYFYLHCQYNGWFLFFLQAVLFQSFTPANPDAARRALWWLAAGAVLTLAQSALWLHPPGWVYVIAALGGGAQLVGCVHLLRALRGSGALFTGMARALAVLALGGFLLKHILQAASALSVLSHLVNHRFTVIAFLHLVFLGVVAPAIFAWALRHGWLRATPLAHAGPGLFVGASLVNEVLLIAAPLGAFYSPHALLLASLGMTAGAALLVVSTRHRAPTPLPSR
ncbi:MAG: hypothetical protein ABII82_18545 [Verrucomicrobiota bacterium]